VSNAPPPCRPGRTAAVSRTRQQRMGSWMAARSPTVRVTSRAQRRCRPPRAREAPSRAALVVEQVRTSRAHSIRSQNAMRREGPVVGGRLGQLPPLPTGRSPASHDPEHAPRHASRPTASALSRSRPSSLCRRPRRPRIQPQALSRSRQAREGTKSRRSARFAIDLRQCRTDSDQAQG